MSDQDNFLSRWSRRKIEAEKENSLAAGKPAAQPAAQDAAGEADQTEKTIPGSETGKNEAFDLSDLPSLESIGPDTDITAFLRPGVPADLSRAALRRVWTADPAIRDFIGLAENAWDFTSPDATPGFGPLDSGEAQKLIAEFLKNEFGKAASEPAEDVGKLAQSAPAEPDSGRREDKTVPETSPEQDSGMQTSEQAPESLLQSSNGIAAESRESPQPAPSGIAMGNARRGHGSALPN